MAVKAGYGEWLPAGSARAVEGAEYTVMVPPSDPPMAIGGPTTFVLMIGLKGEVENWAFPAESASASNPLTLVPVGNAIGALVDPS
jgi:hypothetical protein